MRLPRMTTRRWMVAVAVTAAILTVARIGWRWKRFNELATSHQQAADLYSVVKAGPPPPINATGIGTAAEEAHRQIEEDKRLWRFSFGGKPGYRMTRSLITADELRRDEEALKQAEAVIVEAETSRRLMALYDREMALYHREMSEKYRRAAMRPWLPVDPDPPPPKT